MMRETLAGASAAPASALPDRLDVVLMCSGQGSQQPGMGVDLLDVPEVARAFEAASDAFGFDVANLVRTADAETLADTRHAQAAITALSIGIGRALEARGVRPQAVLGFSLGQMSALALSGMLADEEAFALVAERARIMGEVADAHPGAMSALLKADSESVADLCAACAKGDVLVPANFNCPGQIVISGTPEAVARAEEAWTAQKKRFSRLATQGAFHSPLMQDAVEPFAAFLETLDFREPHTPLICNTDAMPADAASIRARLARHLTHPVRFDDSVRMLAERGAHTFVEAGFGGVLAGLVRRVDKTLARPCVQDRASFAALLAEHADAAEGGTASAKRAETPDHQI